MTTPQNISLFKMFRKQFVAEILQHNFIDVVGVATS
jgi:hypothetical protein